MEFLGWFYAVFLRKGYDLKERYGEGSWAVITGGSDGIGKGFVEELSK